MRARRGFTLIELMTVIVISATIAVTISAFLQRAVTTFRRVQDEADLVEQMRYALDRLRKCIRHSLSPMSNWQGNAGNAFLEKTETLFWISDMDQNKVRELHFVWYDRHHTTLNDKGTNELMHVWNTVPALDTANIILPSTPAPPNLDQSARLDRWLEYARNPLNFNSGRATTVQTGWEVLLNAPFSTNGASTTGWPAPVITGSGFRPISAGGLPVYLRKLSP